MNIDRSGQELFTSMWTAIHQIGKKVRFSQKFPALFLRFCIKVVIFAEKHAV